MNHLRKDVEQTLISWIRRVGTEDFHYVREVFPGDTPSERAHRRRCRTLVKKAYLEPEHDDGLHHKGKISTDQMMNLRFRPTI